MNKEEINLKAHSTEKLQGKNLFELNFWVFFLHFESFGLTMSENG